MNREGMAEGEGGNGAKNGVRVCVCVEGTRGVGGVEEKGKREKKEETKRETKPTDERSSI